MVSYLVKKSHRILDKNDVRSKIVLRNIISSFIVKIGNILISLLIIPITIDYISIEHYGIWITISSLVSWINLFDIGIGNGLKNKLTISITNNNYFEAKKYVSTTYGSLICISIVLLFIYIMISKYINWNEILNLPSSLSSDINKIVFISVLSFLLQFITQTINTVLIAVHESAKASMVTFIGQLFGLIGIYILKETTDGSLVNLIWILTLAPVIILIFANVYFFMGKYKTLSPEINKVDFKYVKDILTVGGKFFMIQIGAVILFQTNNLIITNILGPESVTKYNIVFKLFSVITMILAILMTPFWSAFTEAYAKNDFIWINSRIKKIRLFWFVLALFSLLICNLSEVLIKIWIGKEILVDKSLIVLMTIYVIANSWMMVHTYFLNGVGIVRLQLYLVIICACLNIPLSVSLGRLWGLDGIVIANIIIVTVLGFFLSKQTNKIIKQKALGLWIAQ